MGALSPATSYRQLIRDEKISPSDNFFFESNYSPSSPSVDWWRLSSRRDVIMTAIHIENVVKALVEETRRLHW